MTWSRKTSEFVSTIGYYRYTIDPSYKPTWRDPFKLVDVADDSPGGIVIRRRQRLNALCEFIQQVQMAFSMHQVQIPGWKAAEQFRL